MIKKIRSYSVLILVCTSLALVLFQAPLVKLLSLLKVHTIDSIAHAQTYYRSFIVNTASGSGETPHAATDGSNYVYITYQTASSVDFRKSVNNGVSFSDAVSVRSEVGGYFARISMDNAQEAYVAYTFQNTNYFPSANKSTHTGVGGDTYSFTEKQAWDDFGAGYQGALTEIARSDIAVDGSDVYVVSDDDDTAGVPPGNPVWHIYFSTSSDAGQNWSAPAAISATDDARLPAIAVRTSGTSDDVYAAWINVGSNVMFNYSINNGGAWTGEAAINGGGTSIQNQLPGLAASDVTGTGWVFANWCANDGTSNNVYFDYSGDGGANWNPDVELGDSTYASDNQEYPSIAAEVGSNHLYAA